jgi:hypothetical protein
MSITARVVRLSTPGLMVLLALGSPSSVLAQAPTPQSIVRQACDAAGGLAAFRALGILRIGIDREEISQDGTKTGEQKTIYIATPGPVPGRMEIPAVNILIGDDGSGGWALVGGQVDQRAATSYIVKRSLQSDLFPLLMPFSLTWDGVNLSVVEEIQVSGRKIWRLPVRLDRNFFHTPQMPTEWRVEIDQETKQVVRAECPYVDLGHGIESDGWRINFEGPTKLSGVTFFGLQRIIGINQQGMDNAHNRMDRHTFATLPKSQSAKLFGNPIPPEKRPKPPAMQPPPGMPRPPGPGA